MMNSIKSFVTRDKKFVPPGTLQRFEHTSENEIELFESSRERETYDNLADLYTIILATERIERAYARDAITRDEVGVFYCHILSFGVGVWCNASSLLFSLTNLRMILLLFIMNFPKIKLFFLSSCVQFTFANPS